MSPVEQRQVEPGLEPADSSGRASPNILFINDDFPIFPGSGGVEFRNSTGLARLAPHVGIVSMAHFEEHLAGAAAFLERGVELYLWRNPGIGTPQPRRARPAWMGRLHIAFVNGALRLKAFPFRPLDTLTADLNFRNMSASLLQAIAARHWTAVGVVQSTSAAAIDYMPKPDVSVLVMHDIRSLVFARRARTARAWRDRIFCRRQARRYFNFEKKYARRYDLLVAVSETDAQWIREHYAPNRVTVVPIAVDGDYFAPGTCAERPGRILFTGLMQHPPNIDAAIFFAREIFPRIRKEMPEAEFWIVGKFPAPEVLALAGLPGITVTGGVPDTRPYFSEAAVFVVPLRFGSGVRHKILEAWAMEKCVISTTVGAEGLACRDGVDLAIADGPENMAGAVVRALRDPDYRRALGAAGRQTAVTRHDPGRIAADYYRELRQLAAEKLEARPMRIALDMRWLTPGLAGGLENLARSFVRQLIALDRHNSYTMILPARCRHDFDLRGRGNFKVLCRDSLATAARHLLWRATCTAHAALRLDYWRSPEVYALQFLRSLDAEMVYSFPGYIHPEVAHLRQVLMVPDIQHEYLPELFSEQALSERRRIYTDSIHRADHICAISEFTRRTLIERLNVPPEKVTTVLLAADPIFRPAADPLADRSRLSKYALADEPFLFFPGHTWFHKNHRAVLAALVILRQTYGLAPQLICTGGAREAQPALEKQAQESGLARQVRFLGYCPHEDLPALYRGAGCLVFPSLFEGFGIPVLEAMACGCPVVCSNTTSLPEIAGDAALLVDPNNPEELAGAIAAVLQDRELAAGLAARGLRRAGQFSWRRHTMETISVFHRLHLQLRSPSPR